MYYTVIRNTTVGKNRCRQRSGCVGIEFINTRCEVWTRRAGIEATGLFFKETIILIMCLL